MLTNLYVFIIIIIPIVQIISSSSLDNNNNKPMTIQELEPVVRLKRYSKNIKKSVNKINADLQNEAKFFESIIETFPTSTTSKVIVTVKKRQKPDKNYAEIKLLLAKLLDRMQELEKDKREEPITHKTHIPTSTVNTLKVAAPTSSQRSVVPSVSSKLIKKKKKEEGNRRQRWGHWTDWSSCSVSCGKGREIRWRHCVEDCDDAETEMEEKTCQLPACGPGKLFGVIQLR